MPERREFLIGGMAVGAFGLAEYLRPRNRIRLLSGAKLDDIVPNRFGQWTIYPGGSVIAPVTPNSLADRLYSETLTRIYLPVNGNTPPVMLLLAYGGEQSDLLQLHRPESCYPAVGMGIARRQMGNVAIGNGAQVPSVFLRATGQDRVEDIVYWTRLGEALPRTASEQRDDRLKAAMKGDIGDGMLVRASALSNSQTPSWGYLSAFLADFVEAIPQKNRAGFIGTQRASMT